MEDEDATSPSSSFRYDVFLSFRGDTRHTFTDHLYSALINKGVITFRDNPNLRVGDSIRHSLLEAIEKSRISIVVLCQNYASSSCCLDELVKIMECKDKDGRSVFPIFYHINPSDIRHQKNKYQAAMITHENRYGKDSGKVKAWRLALFTVCELSGKHCTEDMYESEIIKKLVEEVLEKLPSKPLHIKSPIGFDSQIEKAESLLDIESPDSFRMLGIYGDDKERTTTFALELYNKVKHQFQAASFLENVSVKSKHFGLENLQKTLLSEMGEEANTKIGSTFKGSSEIKQRLGHKRVLLVLDDVDNIQQLDSLAGGRDWFGLGSKIIITTRDKDVLSDIKIKIYYIQEEEGYGNKERRDMEEEDVVGFVDSFRLVVNQLKEEDAHSNVVSIIGMGGLGKTTLARKIYNNNEVKETFPCRAWFCVSKDYKAREVFSGLLHCLASSTSEFNNSSEEEVKQKVRKYLKRTKYLVVLDDVWEPQVWDDVKCAFPNEKNGSRVLITSRNNEVANYTSPRPPCYIPFLNEEESWELFCKKVFWGGQCPSDLEPIGRSMVESCGGLPIAILSLAGILAKKKRSQREWLRIKGHVNWHLSQDNTKVMDVLKLSYDKLPERLKPCFLYFAIFPEDSNISACTLIQLWIAEGFIQPQECGISNAPELEDVAEAYLDDLVDRSLVQVASRRSDGGVKICQIHDLLRDLCISLCKADEFLEVCSDFNTHTPNNPCRLSLLCNAQLYMSSIKCNQSNTRSLFFFNEQEHPDHTLKHFQSVNVLHLGRKAYFTTVPSDLKMMVHLRYLRIERNGEFRYVPDSIWSLQNLETLDLSSWYTKFVGGGFWKLKRLRHLYLRWEARMPTDKPIANTEIMWNLQTIFGVCLDRQMAIILENGSFPKLRKLGLWCNPKEESLHELLQSLQHLRNLHKLKLKFCLAKLTLASVVFPVNLTSITFYHFDNLDCLSMSTLGLLPNLQRLKLLKGTLSLNCAAGEFPQLQALKLDFVHVQTWRFEEGAMRLLRRLRVTTSQLSEFPEQLWSLTTLRQVDVLGACPLSLRNSLQNIKVHKDCKIRIPKWVL